MSSTTINRRLPRANGFWKLYLLMCKNTSVLLAHPLSTAIILIAPILLFLYTQVDQLANPKKPIERTETRYPHIEIGHPNISSIMYSPTNNVLRPVMEDMAQNLGANLTEAFLYASEMESALKSRDGFVGIEFDDKLRTIIEMPLKVTVSIRFPLHFRTRANSVWTNRLYKVLTKRSDKSVYDKEGFLIVQSKLSEAIIRSRNQSAYIPQVLMQPFPDRQRTDYSYLDPLFHKFLTHFTFIFMAPSLIIGQLIVTEKQRHLRELMRAMGLSIGMNWLSWFIISYLVMAIPMLILVCLMKVFLCPSTPFFVLLFIYMIYILTLICFTFMICTFVRSTTMVLTTLTLIQILSVLPFLITTNEMTTTKSVIVALFMNSAMASIWVQVCGFEIRGLGAQWKLLFHYSHPDDKISIGSILLIMLATNLVRLLFCFYADQLNLGEFGVAKKWYFPCKRKFWCPWERPRVQRLRRTRYESMDEERGRISNRNVNTTAYEVVLNQNPVVIEAQNLKKTYGGNDAVRDFSLKFYKDEITAMIGPNGSGKTTLFMMLAGLCRPSSGRVMINGHDLTLVPQMARHSFSVCPQHDVLFEELTAYWHIVFFSRLKGFQRTEAESEAQRYLEILNLMDKSTVSVKQLSVGMRRKLSICCALCANTKVLVCDEPTSCLDPLARYEVWSLLRKEKAGRCIVMTTHIMEAATFVGDRIAILCEGQLYSYGSPDFIVNNLGLGYRLVCSALDNCNVSEVTKYLMNRIPNVELEKIVGSEIHYRLPVKDVDKFTTLFKSLESKLDALKLTSFDVSAPTLSETFIKIGNDKKNRERTSSGNEEIYNAWATEPIDKKEHNLFRRRRNDWHGMMIKKILFTRNHLFQFILIVILPLLAILLNLLIDLIAKKAQRVFINPLDLSVYPRSMVIHEFLAEHNDDDGNHIFTDHSADVSEAYEMVAMEAGATVRMAPDGLGLDEFLLKNIDLFKEGFQETYVAGVTFRDGSVTAWFNRRLEHGAPLSLGLVYKAIAFVLVKMDIDIINHPRPDSDKSEHEHANILSTIKQTTFLLLYLCFAISAFVMLPVQERVMHMKEQHLISGVRLSTYWLSHLLCDFIIFLLILVVMLLALYKQNSQEIIWFMVVVLVFGLSALTFTYLLSFLFKDPGSAMLYMLVINCSVVMMGISMSTKHEDKVYKYFHHIFLILPFYAMYSAFIEIFRLSHQKSTCAHVNNQQNSCDQLAVHISKELIYLIVSGIIFFILLLLTSKWRLLRYAIKRQVRKCAVNNEDAFVRYARQQVDKIVKDENQLKECSLVCDRATRKKQNFLLVNCVSLKILPSECFAIIGLNNAGKSSFVKMVVGDHMISQGDIYVKGFSVKTQLNKCHEHMSYCEQNSNLWKYMTGRQMLRVVGLTSGIKKEFIPKIISYLAQAFTLTKDLDKKYKYYSSGTQKKLNIALAMLGRTLICLDEPTTGVDIGAKAEIWLALKQLLDLGRSILITSHNMAECQTLSTSVGVMVNGALTCYGSVEDLLDRYSKGITIKIQIATESEIAEINSKVSDSESKYSTNSSISFQERKLSKHQSVDIESDTERPSSSHRLSEDQDPNTKWTQVKKKDLKPIAPKMPSQVLTQMSSTRTTSIQERRVTTSTPRTISRRTTGLTYSMTIESQSYINSPEQYELIKRVERQFKHDFPGSFVAEKLTLSGLVTIVIPDNDLKWSTVFKYMEQQRVPLQIKHYSINYTTLQDIFLEFARDENAD